MNPQTQNTENCPHCGAEYKQTKDRYFFECGTERIYGWDNTKCYAQSTLCREREARQKVEKELDLYKHFVSETVAACEPLRNINRLQLGERISVEGVKLMIDENYKLRELIEELLHGSTRSPAMIADEYNQLTTIN